jgi:phospholipid-binding lipoprotein MlaA
VDGVAGRHLRLIHRAGAGGPLTDSLQKLPDYYSALRNVVAQNQAAFALEGKHGMTSPEADECAKGSGDDF